MFLNEFIVKDNVKEKHGMRELLDLFLAFARIGGFTFGGGYAMLPMLHKEVVLKKRWATEEDLMDYYAVGQCTPGIIAVNTATFVGYKEKGIIGAIAATAGVISPSLVIIMIITAFVNNFSSLTWVQHALAGIRICVCVLVLDAVIKLAKKSLVDAAAVGIFCVVMGLSLFTDIPTFVCVIAAGVAGILIKVIGEGRKAPGTKGEVNR